MPIAVQCSGCSAKFAAPDKLAGQQTNCPKCGNLLLIGLERMRVQSSPAPLTMAPVSQIVARPEKPPTPPAASLEAGRKSAALAAKSSATTPAKPAASSQTTKPAQQKPAAQAAAAASTKPPMIGPTMRRVLIILGVVAAILYAMNEVGRMLTRPRFGAGENSGQKFGYFKDADLNDPEVQKQLEALLGAEEEPKPKPSTPKPSTPKPAPTSTASNPTPVELTTSITPKPVSTSTSSSPTPVELPKSMPESPWRGLSPPPNRLDPLGGSPSFLPYESPASYKALPYKERKLLKLGLEYRPLPSGVTQLDRHWNGEQLGMSLDSFLQRYRQDVPQPGWPYLITSDAKKEQQHNYFPKYSLQEQRWHFEAGVENARIVLPQDCILHRDRLRSPELPLYHERLYCFLDGQLALIRYVVPNKDDRKGNYPDPGQVYCCETETPEEYAKLYELPRENIRRWANGDFEILHIRDVYRHGREIILHRHVKLCEELNRRRLAAQKLADRQ